MGRSYLWRFDVATEVRSTAPSQLILAQHVRGFIASLSCYTL